MFTEKHIMSMTTEEMQKELENTQKNIDDEERKRKLQNKLIWCAIGLAALISFLS